MKVLDYHRRLMDGSIWNSDEMTLASNTRRHLHHQMSRRFPNAKAVYLVGELVGHYYEDTSDLDILVRVADSHECRRKPEAATTDRFRLRPDHRSGEAMPHFCH